MKSKVLVLGGGVSGRAAAGLLGRQGREAVVLDGDVPVPEGDFDFAVVSPGVALSHPWLTECRSRGIGLKSELQLGCEELRRRGWKLLAVTGSKGKSSVVKIVSDAISSAGTVAVPCGNYGLAVSELALEDRCGWAVVEVSSFQLETTSLSPDTFEAAVILNLQEDHLDRHGSIENYHALKRSLSGMAVQNVVPGALADVDSVISGSYFDNEVLRSNGAAAAALMAVAGVDEERMRHAFSAFKPLAHRMNVVLERDGVKYVDDSKATSLSAMKAALEMIGSGVRLIAGGLPKGDDPRSLIPDLTKRVKKVYLIGRCAGAFGDAWSGSVDCEICGTLEKAVAGAAREARTGETVLLSPGCASYDQFENFGQRGDVFAALVEKEGQKK